jgi:hypothetical protein
MAPLHETQDLGLASREVLHREALEHEYAAAEARVLLRAGKNLASIEVTPLRGAAPPGRLRVREMLRDHERILVFGNVGAGKSALVAHLALHPEWREGVPEDWHEGMLGPDGGALALVVPVEQLEPGELVTVATLARLCPAAGEGVVARVLAEHRALVVVDGLDQLQEGRAAFVTSIVDFSRAHPGNRFVVTTRPLPPAVPGARPPGVPGFLPTAILPPLPPSRVHPSYRFVGARSPERRATLYLDQVETLLSAWSADALPPGAALGRIDGQTLRALVMTIAEVMHGARDYEIDAKRLAATIAGELGGGDAGAELAASLVREIRAHPALLVERRPGRFAFSDFVLQEVLVAARLLDRETPQAIVDLRADAFRHGVIELAAGLPGARPEAMVQALLAADHGEPPLTTLLAARCAEAVPTLPDRLRRTIDRRLDGLVPPEHQMAADRLVEAGEVAAPLVLRALPRGEPEQRALSALVLGELRYEPACGALVALAADRARVRGPLYWSVAGNPWNFDRMPVASCALAALLDLARVCEMGRRAFGRALARAPRDVVADLLLYIERVQFDVLLGEADPVRDVARMAALVAQIRKFVG